MQWGRDDVVRMLRGAGFECVGSCTWVRNGVFVVVMDSYVYVRRKHVELFSEKYCIDGEAFMAVLAREELKG